MKKRERIIFYCQHLFHDQLLNSPSEFIINYIDKGCPLIEPRHDFHSKLSINNAWKDICSNKRKTFIFDYKVLKRQMRLFQKFSKQIDTILHRVVLDITVSDEELGWQRFVNFYYRQLMKNQKNYDTQSEKIIKISILFVFYVLCLGVDVDNSPIYSFWQKEGIKEPFHRLSYLMKKYEKLFFQGPFYEMAVMAYHQITLGEKSNRGLFMDCLHSIYITYADIFITNDKHFKTLKDKIDNPNFLKVKHISEIEIRTSMKDIYKPENTI